MSTKTPPIAADGDASTADDGPPEDGAGAASGASIGPDSVAQAFYGVGLATLIASAAYFGRGVLIPFVVAAFASFLIFTVKQGIRTAPIVGKRLPHWLCYVLAFAAIVSCTILFIEIVARNVEEFVTNWPRYEERLRTISADAVRRVGALEIVPEDFIGGLEELRADALSAVSPVVSGVADTARALTSNSVTIFLYTVFMLLERGRLLQKVDFLFASERQRDAVNETIGEIAAMVRQYITVKTVTNLITALISFAILSFVGVDFAGFWALLIFVLNYIPIVGAISAITLPVLLALVQPEGGGVRTAALALGLLVAAEQTMSSGIEPRLIGRSLNLSPLVILLSLAVWGAIWGFAGALLAVPITVTVMIVLTQFEPTRPIAVLLSDSGQIAPIKHAPLRP
ncbi:MAG: AI-2E family transporter [Parvularculaceae bacterium]